MAGTPRPVSLLNTNADPDAAPAAKRNCRLPKTFFLKSICPPLDLFSLANVGQRKGMVAFPSG
jgi:hypothetical protein